MVDYMQPVKAHGDRIYESRFVVNWDEGQAVKCQKELENFCRKATESQVRHN